MAKMKSPDEVTGVLTVPYSALGVPLKSPMGQVGIRISGLPKLDRTEVP